MPNINEKRQIRFLLDEQRPRSSPCGRRAAPHHDGKFLS